MYKGWYAIKPKQPTNQPGIGEIVSLISFSQIVFGTE